MKINIKLSTIVVECIRLRKHLSSGVVKRLMLRILRRSLKCITVEGDGND